MRQSNSENTGTKRGRPRRYEPPRSLNHLPLDQPLADLSPSVRALLHTGRVILAEHGYRAVTLEAVALRAGVGKSTLVEQFGNRACFLATLFDSLMQEGSVRLASPAAQALKRTGRAEDRVRALATLYADAEVNRLYLELAANALREEPVRARLAALDASYRRVRKEMLASSDVGACCGQEELELLASLLGAAEDGLILQNSLAPGSVDVEEALSLLGHLFSLLSVERADEEQGTP